MKVYQLREPLIYNYLNAGFFSFICRDKNLIAEITPRKAVCLKIFFKPLVGDINDYYWGNPFLSTNGETEPRSEQSLLIDAVRIQNLCAFHNLAPRVYSVIGLKWQGNIYPAFVVDDLGESNDFVSFEDRHKIIDQIKVIGEEYGFTMRFEDIGQSGNFMKGKFVDFQSFEFLPEYRDKLIERYKKNAVWSENTYQSVPELGIEGYRDNERRVELMQLDTIDLWQKNVVDVGCSGGFYSRYAESRGAKRILGLDLPSVAKSAFEISNYLCGFNIDFTGNEIKRDIDYKFGFVPDVIFYLSVYRYFGYAPFLKQAQTVIYEHNGDVTEEQAIAEFSKDFPNHVIIGNTGKTTGSNDERKTIIFTK